jgi:hypothetical protein
MLSYEIDVSPLHDFRGLLIGHLLLLRDVTEHKRAEARALEQQRTLAVLQEREHLARELHDSIGQVLGYANMQLEVVHDRITDGQSAIAAGRGADANAHGRRGNQVVRLGSTSKGARRPARIHPQPAPGASEERLCLATLQRYLDGFSQNYGIQAECRSSQGRRANG